MEGTSFHGDRIGRKVRGREMGFIIPLMRSPRKEEQNQQVPENDVTSSQSYNYHGACEGGDGAGRMANELGGMLSGDEEMLKWDTLEMKEEEISFSPAFWDNSVEKGETVTSASASSNGLNLNLNYQEVLDEWSNRGPLWARDYYYSSRFPQCHRYMGEVPEMEVEAEGGRGGCWSKSREASVMRYKEKRQSRLFSNRIRYQVRKLNADSRPRLKVLIFLLIISCIFGLLFILPGLIHVGNNARRAGL